VVLKALAKDPRQRYTSVQLFAQALELASQASEAAPRYDSDVIGKSAAPLLSPFTPSRYVFLSASDLDDPFAARLEADLQKRGIAIWKQDPLGEGSNKSELEEDVTRQAIRAVDIVLIVLSRHTRTSRIVKEHMRIADMYQRRLVFVCMAGDDIEAVLPEWLGKTIQIDLFDARGTRYECALDEILSDLQRPLIENNGIAPLPPVLKGEPRNPYKGLRTFTKDDAGDFFGRETLIEELTDDVKSMLASERTGSDRPRLLTVIGPSGSGKSSVVLAGLLPRLQQGVLQKSEDWIYMEPLMPGVHPMEALAFTLATRFPERSLKSIGEDLEDEMGRGLHLLARQLVKDSQQYVLLLIDQFEELFAPATSEEERRWFIELLTTAISEPRGPVIIILTLRADFYDRTMAYPELCRLIDQHHKLVLPMEIQELRAAIKQPAALPDVQMNFEGKLVGDLLYEVQGQIGALPLLQFTLDHLFERREDHLLTLHAYREIGGVKGALAKQAEATYAALPSDEHRRLARFLFLRLIEPGINEQDSTRRRAALTEFSLFISQETEMIQQVAAAFVTARLLTTNVAVGTPTIEVSHEALIREWKRLSGWLREAREDIQLQHSIRKDAAEWERRGKPHDRLYRGTQLKDAKAWAKRDLPSKQEAVFLHASGTHRVHSRIRFVAIIVLLVFMTGLVARLVLGSNSLNLTTVTTLSDQGPGSLRQVIITASPGSTITFDKNLRGTIDLFSDDLNIPKFLIIRGPGVSMLSISGKNGHGIHIPAGVSVTLADLTITGGSTALSGGGIYNQGTLTLTNTIISGNKAPVGGGGIYNQGTLTLTNSTVAGNTAGSGGGILNQGTLMLTDSTVSGNTASINGGGGILNQGTLMLTRSTISGNTSGTFGGGIFNRGGTLTLINSTIASNLATGNNQGNGGGISIYGGQVTMVFSTIYGNTTTQGGGIAIEDNTSGNLSGQLTLSDSLIAGNQAQVDPSIMGHLTTSGYNLIQGFTDATFNGPLALRQTDKFLKNLTDVKIAPLLQNNDGQTQTYALLPGSPLIDQIPAALCVSSGIFTDQRGVKRPQGVACDIGSYEYEPHR
jgi:hypothetical protein